MFFARAFCLVAALLLVRAPARATEHGAPATESAEHAAQAEVQAAVDELPHVDANADAPVAVENGETTAHDPQTEADSHDGAEAPQDAGHEKSGPVAATAAGEAAGLKQLAASLTERGDWPAAEIAYRQIISRPEFSKADVQDALLGMAMMYRKQGMLTKSSAIYQKFLKTYPEDERLPDVYLELGRTLRAMGAHKLAVGSFYSVINSTLKIPREQFDHYQLLARTAQFEIADTYFDSGNYTEAGKFFDRLRLLELAPVDRARAQFMLGRAQQLSDKLDLAARTFRQFLEQWPDAEQAPEAGYLLATTLRALNRSEEALAVTQTLLRSASEQSKGNPRLWAYWQRRTGNQLANDFFQGGNILSALDLYKALVALSDDPAWQLPVTYQIGLCQERLLDTQRAIATYRSVIDGIGALGERATAELQEVSRMAAWRLDHMSWQQNTTQTLAAELKPQEYPEKDDADRSTTASPRAD